tara:strand:- start:4220 stop:4456 length:237 start_codon:yes stop_codon:yes gene_type:complete
MLFIFQYDMVKYTVEVADATGHSMMELSFEEIKGRANEGSWLFVDNKMVDSTDIEDMDLNDSTLRLVPALQAGVEDDE